MIAQLQMRVSEPAALANYLMAALPEGLVPAAALDGTPYLMIMTPLDALLPEAEGRLRLDVVVLEDADNGGWMADVILASDDIDPVRLAGLITADLMEDALVDVPTNRGMVKWPGRADGSVVLVHPRTPRHAFAGIALPIYEGDEIPLPEWFQPEGAHDAWALGAVCGHAGKRWVSTREANVWKPGTFDGGWRELVPPGGIEDWVPRTAYALGDEVAHAGQEWRSRRNNNVWEPGTSDSGWLRISNLPAPWVHIGNEGYPLGWQTTHNGRLWDNPSAGNFWEPGVAVWTDMGPAP